MSDFSSIIKSTGVALEREALAQFGAAVENQVKGTLGSIFSPNGGPRISESDAQLSARNAQIGVWEPTKYAASIAESNLRPKNKFLFKVRFELYEEVKAVVRQVMPDVSEILQDLTFVVKQIDLPTVQFDYQDVNLYNFRTKVLKSISYRDLNVTFYDDVANNAINFVKLYLLVLMPITRKMHTSGAALHQDAMAFAQNYASSDTSYRGALPFKGGDAALRSRYDIISKMIIEQYYHNPSPGDQSATTIDSIKMNTFVFANPKILTLDVSDLDHENGSTANTIESSFSFDAIYIENNNQATASRIQSRAGNDILDGTEEKAAQDFKRGAAAQQGKGGNPFVNIIVNQGQRAVQVGLSDALNKKFGGIAGGALGGAIGALSGGLAAAAGESLRSVATGVSQSIALPKVPFIRNDSNTSADDAAKLSNRDNPPDYP
jgi:hypothetical protein